MFPKIVRCVVRVKMSHTCYCKCLHGLWCIIGKKLKLSIKLKHIKFGLQNVTDKHYVCNLVIVIIAFSIYKSWNTCSFNRLE